MYIYIYTCMIYLYPHLMYSSVCNYFTEVLHHYFPCILYTRDIANPTHGKDPYHHTGLDLLTQLLHPSPSICIRPKSSVILLYWFVKNRNPPAWILNNPQSRKGQHLVQSTIIQSVYIIAYLYAVYLYIS